jgi:hypothetical protein
MADKTMSRYEQACAKACKWCEQGVKLSTLFSGQHIAGVGPCTAPTLADFAESESAAFNTLREVFRLKAFDYLPTIRTCDTCLQFRRVKRRYGALNMCLECFRCLRIIDLADFLEIIRGRR